MEPNQDIVMNAPANTSSSSSGKSQQAHKQSGRTEAQKCSLQQRLHEFVETEAAEGWPEEFVVGHEDDDEFEELEELRKVTVGSAPTGRQRRRREAISAQRAVRSVCVCVLRRWAPERTTNIDDGNVKLIQKRKEPCVCS